jgi:alpha 1,2-mannosyltransferase
VECRNLNEAARVCVQGFSARPFCILNSRFAQVLSMEAGNICTRDPSDLFEDREFHRTGCIFWPDHWRTDRANPIWKVIDCEHSSGPDQDSGQILVDRTKVWQELNLCGHFNLNSSFYYQFLMGDRDTFRLAWMALKRPFAMVPHEPSLCGYIRGRNRFVGVTMVQHDSRGEILFLHRNCLKWDITRESERVWQEIRKFREDAGERYYYLNNFGHPALEIYGDTESVRFESLFPSLELECLEILRELRRAPFYQKCLLDSYIMLFRGE